MRSIVEVPFYSDNIQAVREGEQVWVIPRRVCDSLGIDVEAQRQRLRDPERCPWATTCVIQAVANDGKEREVFVLDLKSLPLWLATIDAGRVKPEVRFQLVAYQRECAEVLARHFFGAPSSAAPVPVELLAAIQSLGAAVLEQGKAIVEIQVQLRQIADRGAACITRAEAKSLAARIVRAGKLQAELEPEKRASSHRLQTRMRVLAAAGWVGAGCRYDNLPAHAYPQAERALSVIEGDLIAAMGKAKSSKPVQLTLLKTETEPARNG